MDIIKLFYFLKDLILETSFILTTRDDYSRDYQFSINVTMGIILGLFLVNILVYLRVVLGYSSQYDLVVQSMVVLTAYFLGIIAYSHWYPFEIKYRNIVRNCLIVNSISYMIGDIIYYKQLINQETLGETTKLAGILLLFRNLDSFSSSS